MKFNKRFNGYVVIKKTLHHQHVNTANSPHIEKIGKCGKKDCFQSLLCSPGTSKDFNIANISYRTTILDMFTDKLTM